MNKLFTFFLLCLISTVAYAQRRTENLQKKIEIFDLYAQAGMKDWSIPGMGLLVIRDGQVIFSKTYGVLKYGNTKQVDDHTLFSIGSTTKAMTATCMAILVDEGKVSWDDPVITHFPDLRLYDPYVTGNLRIRDLFTHNSGIGNTDFLWGNMTISSDEIVKRMSMVKPSYPFRGGYVYQNIFYLIAGQVIERVSGKPWKLFIEERIFKPLKMEHTVAMLGNAPKDNLAEPHYLFDGIITPIKRTSADSVGPAGSVYSCINDLAKWANCMLDSGKYTGGRLLKPRTWTELFRPHIAIPEEQFYPTMQLIKPSWTTYGLGWFQHDYKGRKVNYHTGSLPGEIAMHAQLPSERMAFYFVGNLDHAELRHSLVYKAFDLFALGGDRDWNKEFYELYKKLEVNQKNSVNAIFANRVPDTSPSQPLKNYPGKYQNLLQGQLTIEEVGGKLVANLNDVIFGTLEHFHYDTFIITYSERWMGRSLITFRANSEGKISIIESGGESFSR